MQPSLRQSSNATLKCTLGSGRRRAAAVFCPPAAAASSIFSSLRDFTAPKAGWLPAGRCSAQAGAARLSLRAAACEPCIVAWLTIAMPPVQGSAKGQPFLTAGSKAKHEERGQKEIRAGLGTKTTGVCGRRDSPRELCMGNKVRVLSSSRLVLVGALLPRLPACNKNNR